MSDECETCGFSLWNPIKNLSTSSLSLYDDGRFPGRCILKLNLHYEALEDIPNLLLNQYMADVKEAVNLIKQVTGSLRVNIAILGNTVPHVHAHLIPRYPENEQYPGKSPWNDQRLLFPLPELVKQDLLYKFKN